MISRVYKKKVVPRGGSNTERFCVTIRLSSFLIRGMINLVTEVWQL